MELVRDYFRVGGPKDFHSEQRGDIAFTTHPGRTAEKLIDGDDSCVTRAVGEWVNTVRLHDPSAVPFAVGRPSQVDEYGCPASLRNRFRYRHITPLVIKVGWTWIRSDLQTHGSLNGVIVISHEVINEVCRSLC